MKHKRRILGYILCIALGIVLCGLGFAETVDEFWSGMGTALIVVCGMRMVRMYRFNKDENYREMLEIESSDERNQFIRNKAWAWAGYLFICISAVAVIALKALGQEMWSNASCYAMCLMLVMYWGAYYILKKKY